MEIVDGGTMRKWDDEKKSLIVPKSQGLIVKKTELNGYFPFSPMIERPQMRPYHKKFLLGIRHRTRLTYHGNLYLAGIGHLVLNLLAYIVR